MTWASDMAVSGCRAAGGKKDTEAGETEDKEWTRQFWAAGWRQAIATNIMIESPGPLPQVVSDPLYSFYFSRS